MNIIIKQIPNTLTLCSLFFGCLAICTAFQFPLESQLPGLFIFLAAIFDFLDGMAARALKAYSPIGKELDSLADVVSFGVAPAMILYLRLNSVDTFIWVPYTAFLLTLFSAYRLAKFNVDERQTSSFIGLPTPANAIFWIGLTYAFPIFRNCDICIGYGIPLLIVLMSWLMISEIPMFSFKLSSFSLTKSWRQLTLLLVSILSIVLFGYLGLSLSIAVYIILSLISSK